jgi:predicted Na+-dependent transporter
LSPTILVDLAVGIVLGLVMFGVGLSLTFSDFKRVIRHPRAFFTGLSVQMVGLPVIAFTISLLAPIPDEIKVGLIILAASPGGATSGFLTYLWKGNVALSLSLTSVNSLLTLFSIPVVVNLGLRVFLGKSSDLHLPFWDTVGHIFFITIIPATLGILIRRRFPRTAANQYSFQVRHVGIACCCVHHKVVCRQAARGIGAKLRRFFAYYALCTASERQLLVFWLFFHAVHGPAACFADHSGHGKRGTEYHTRLSHCQQYVGQPGNGKAGLGVLAVFFLDSLYFRLRGQSGTKIKRRSRVGLSSREGKDNRF